MLASLVDGLSHAFLHNYPFLKEQHSAVVAASDVSLAINDYWPCIRKGSHPLVLRYHGKAALIWQIQVMPKSILLSNLIYQEIKGLEGVLFHCIQVLDQEKRLIPLWLILVHDWSEVLSVVNSCCSISHVLNFGDLTWVPAFREVDYEFVAGNFDASVSCCKFGRVIQGKEGVIFVDIDDT